MEKFIEDTAYDSLNRVLPLHYSTSEFFFGGRNVTCLLNVNLNVLTVLYQ